MEKVNLREMSDTERVNKYNDALNRFQKKETIVSIARQTGIHRTTISRWLNKGMPSFEFGRRKQYDTYTDQDLREKLLRAVSSQRDSIWSAKSIQQFFWDTYKKEVSLYHAKKCISHLLSLPVKEQIIKCFERPYISLGSTTPSDYAKKHKLRCNYLLHTKKVFKRKYDKGIHIVCSPRGDIRFSCSSLPVLFKNLISSSKNEILLVYLKDLLSRDEVLHYSKNFLRITFVSSE